MHSKVVYKQSSFQRKRSYVDEGVKEVLVVKGKLLGVQVLHRQALEFPTQKWEE